MKKVFITFLVLIFFVFSCGSPQKKEEPPVLVPDEMASSNKSVVADEIVVDANPVVESVVIGGVVLPFDANIRETSRGSILVFPTNALFAYGSSDVPDSAYDVFSGVKFFLENNPDATLIFETHTGNIGSAVANYKLSVVRMTNGIEFMKTMSIPLNRVEPIALGEAVPEYIDQRKLRRYEFVIIRNNADKTKYNNFIKTISTNKESDGKVVI